MSINIKKYTKDQMAKMVEEAQEKQGAAEAEAAAHFKDGVKLAEENEKLRGEIGTLTERLDQMNGEVINKANEIANLKADLDTLRNKLADTEAALGRANAEVSRMTVGCRQVEEGRDYMHQQWSNAEQRANYAESHPWRNLWAWLKRKLKMA
jgi:chromosome segregation ATPase